MCLVDYLLLCLPISIRCTYLTCGIEHSTSKLASIGSIGVQELLIWNIWVEVVIDQWDSIAWIGIIKFRKFDFIVIHVFDSEFSCYVSTDHPLWGTIHNQMIHWNGFPISDVSVIMMDTRTSFLSLLWHRGQFATMGDDGYNRLAVRMTHPILEWRNVKLSWIQLSPYHNMGHHGLEKDQLGYRI